jgi:hypothetical protein
MALFVFTSRSHAETVSYVQHEISESGVKDGGIKHEAWDERLRGFAGRTTDRSNIRFWEQTGKVPRSDVLVPMAKALGVTAEELPGEPKAKPSPLPAGKVRRVIEAVTRLPRHGPGRKPPLQRSRFAPRQNR